jgi:hypothetical protein
MSVAHGFLLAAAAGLALVASGIVALRIGGANLGLARRLAGPRQVAVGQLVKAEVPKPPERPVRVAGRIRCSDPIRLADDERIVILHRDVEVHGPHGWQSIERLRETRSFELWDHNGSLPLDPALTADPLIAIPAVWRGSAAQLEEPHASSARRLAERIGPLTAARATTRTVGVTDRLLVVAVPRRRTAGEVLLDPPPGGYVITNLALPDAMRLLGGRRRRLAAGSVIALAVGAALGAIGLVGASLALLAG